MKKIALLLAMVFVLTALTCACKGGDVDTSDDSSVSSEESSTEKLFVLTGVPVAENANATVVSNGATYKKVIGANAFDADAAYPDTYGTELTDGIRCGTVDGNYDDEALSGYTSTFNIEIDLGQVYDKLYQFKVGYLSTSNAGIGTPSSVSVYASIDNKKWTRVATCEKPEAIEGAIQDAVATVNGYICAQYIRFTVGSSSAWIFLDEVSVIADVEGSQKNIQYLSAVKSAYETLGTVSQPKSDVVIDKTLDKVLVSQNAKYTVDGEYKNFTDPTKKMLTDGILSGYYEGETWVGFATEEDVTVTVDLGKTVNDIASVEANFFTNTAINIYLPVAVKVAAIDENDNRTELGILYGNAVMGSGDYIFSIPFQNAISARYIEYTFVATPDSNVFMVEELGVYSYRVVEKKLLYPELVFEEGATEWGNEGSGEYVNLIAGKTQQIIASNEVADEHFENNTKVDSKLMTDGIRSTSTDIHNGKFFKFSNGGNRTVIYDLEHLSAVDKFTASFVERTDWAVSRPSKVTVCVSPDGNNWYQAGDVELIGSTGNEIYKGTLELAKAVNVRYVAFGFNVGAWVGCDELEVFGKKNSSGSTVESVLELTPGFFSTKRIEPSEEILGGTKDLCLMYHSKNNYYVAEDLIPYIAYVDTEGNIKDLMFDNFLFLYNNNAFPSGARPHSGGLMSDWQWTIDDLFTDGRNIMALEDAAGQVKTALGLADDYKFMYSVTLYYPIKFDDNGRFVAYNFGDIDGDGEDETTANYEDRVVIMKWYIDSIEKIVAEKNFQNIELVGYYWWHEAIENVDADGHALLNEISDMVHETGKSFFWIPYYCSNGYNRWADYGFDVACMQPNYVFDAEAPYSKVVNCAQLTSLYGMGFEMEVDSTALSQEMFYKKYMEYLGSGATLGYMNDTINMYYQSVTVFRDAAKADSTMARNVYDQTYHFIKGDLVYNPDALTGLTFDAEANTPYTVDLEFSTDIPRQFRMEITPDHGAVTLNGDGTFTFYPEKNYTGEVTFSFAYNEYLGWSDPCEVTINVK